DVCVQSQTGTGKTAAYLLSVFELMTQRDDLKERMTVIIAPTRELAVQIEAEARLLGAHVDLRIGCFYGGVGYGAQEQRLAEGVDIVIGTPGRLIDFSQSRKLDFSRTGIVIIDEADRLFDMGFYPDIRRILRKMPPREERVSMLFSATLSTRARNIAWEHMNNPAEVEINPEQVTVEGITQVLYHVGREEKFRLLLGLLDRHKPETTLVFTNTKRAAEEISRRLEMNGHESTFIMGDLPQRKRLRVIEGIKQGRVKLLVATDVAARGLHIEDLDMVINYDLPEDRESYVHRIGRTARAGKSGIAISLADERFVYGLPAIEEFLGYSIPVERVTDELIAEDASAGVRIPLGRHAEGGRDGRARGGRDRSAGDRGGRRSRSGDRRRRRPAEARQPGSPGGTGHEGVREGAQREARAESGGRHREHAGTRAEGAASRRGGSQTGRGNDGRQERPGKSGRGGADRPRPDKRAPVEERIEYYKQKYGEDFELTGSTRKKQGGGKRSGAKPPQRRPEEGREQAPKRDEPKNGTPESGPQSQSGLFGRLRRIFGGGSRSSGGGS
ncbi:DEAD/DEAH box helicase, partial [Salinispira pacifica]